MIDPPPSQKSSRKSLQKVRSRTTRYKNRSSFLNFLQDFRNDPDNKGIKNATEMAKKGGARWRMMTNEQKHPYIQAAVANRSGNTLEHEDNSHNARSNSSGDNVSNSRIKVEEPDTPISKPLKNPVPQGNRTKRVQRKFKIDNKCSRCGHRHGSPMCRRPGWKIGKQVGRKKSDSSSFTRSTTETDTSRRSKTKTRTTFYDTDFSSASTF